MASRKRTKSKNTAPPGRRRRSWLARIIGYGLALLVWGAVGLAGVVAWYAYDLPDIEHLEEAAGKRAPTVTVLAADGTVLAHYGELYGVAVQLYELPPHLPHAVLAVEDRRFYEHAGVDPIGIARAIWTNLSAGTVRSGGSTISQQLAKNLFLSSDRTIRRKVQELLLALWLEQRFGKDQILTIYLNRVYFGQGAYGVDAAARRYFNKPATQVTAYEAAMLAGLLKAPSRYNPLTNADVAAGRAAQVLQSMVEAGWLTGAQAATAKSGRAVLRSDRMGGQSRHFADWVLDRAKDYISHEGGDLVIRTTVDPRLQRLAEAAVRSNLAAAAKRKAGQAAMVAMRPDGAITAMVGGASYGDSQFNRATQALRQPGSAFKLFVYLTAFESGFRPGDEVEDAPVTIDGWTPRNAGGKYRGAVSIREAVARSINSVAASMAERVGREKVVATARRLGITADIGAGPGAGAGRLRGDAAGADGGLCGDGQRRHRRMALRDHGSHGWRGQGAVPAQRRRAGPRRGGRTCRHRQRRADRRHHLGHRQGGEPGPSRRRKDRHQPGQPRRLVHRLHARPDRRGLVRQRRRCPDGQGRRRVVSGADLARFHEARAGRRGAETVAGDCAVILTAAAVPFP